MLFIGYFEGIDSQRRIAWRCQDSFSLQTFLGLGSAESVPDHSSMTKIRDRFPLVVTEQVFPVLQMATERKLVSASQVGVDHCRLQSR